MLNFDGDVKCRQTLTNSAVYYRETLCFMMYENVLCVNESLCFVHQCCVVSHCRLAWGLFTECNCVSDLSISTNGLHGIKRLCRNPTILWYRTEPIFCDKNCSCNCTLWTTLYCELREWRSAPNNEGWILWHFAASFLKHIRFEYLFLSNENRMFNHDLNWGKISLCTFCDVLNCEEIFIKYCAFLWFRIFIKSTTVWFAS